MKWILSCAVLLIAVLLFVLAESETKLTHHQRKEGFRELVQINNETFYFGTNEYNWYDATTQCNLLGMQMLTLDTAERWEMMRDWLLANTEYDGWTWTSGQKLANQAEFVWSTTGQTFNYTAWNNGEPSAPVDVEVCATFWGEMGGWDDDSCTRYFFKYICETEQMLSP